MHPIDPRKQVVGQVNIHTIPHIQKIPSNMIQLQKHVRRTKI